jgi:DNA polymerase bacteriophage-type
MIIRYLHVDFETLSLAQLRGKNSVGLYNYMRHKSTRWLMLAWAIDDGEVHIWFPHEPMPQELKEALEDSNVFITAFNSAFERYAFQYLLGVTIPAERFQDPQASGRYLSLPASLKEQGEVLGLPPELQKDARGEELIDLFSVPQRKKLRGQEPIYYFRNAETNPKEWLEFVEYCFTPNHKLLGQNLIWKAASEFSIGDEVLGFDEKGPRRRFRKAIIEKISYQNANVFDVLLASGKTFRVTAEHRWLTGRKQVRWTETRNLFYNTSHSRQIHCFMEPWEREDTREAGWIAGILDGEGSYSNRRVAMGQNKGAILDSFVSGIEKRGFKANFYNNHGNCKTIIIGENKYDALHALGVFRPQRLVSKANFDTLGAMERRGFNDTIISVTPAGIDRIIKIQTSTGTLIVDGYPMHNCKQDVRSEREIIRRQKLLGAFPLPPLERQIWLLDQKINDRGMPTSREFATKGLALAERDKAAQLQALNDLTGLENANSRDQMLQWMQTQGYKENSLRKGAVDTTLKYKRDELTPLGIQALEARKAASSTSYRKMAAILRQINPDERLRGQFVYMGSPACGRWAGAGFQFHNQARPLEMFEDEEYLNWARAMIFAEDGDAIRSWFQSILLTVKSCIRTAFVAKSKKRLNVCDLNAIETRVGAWIAGCESLLTGFKTIKDFDPYLHFAARLLNIPYEDLIRDKKSKDPATKARIKRYRQFGKVGVLGAIYRLGGGDWGWRTNADGTKDRIKTGLWGFAEAMGIDLTKEEAHNIVDVFRKKAYPEIPACWFQLEAAVKDVLAGVQIVRHIGPSDCITIDKINLLDRHPILRIQLPSGRYLHYFDARIEEKVKMPYKHKEHDEDGNEIEVDVYAPSFVYARQNQTTKQWDPWITSHGGKLFENIVQGIARDVLAEKLLAFENAGLPVVGHVHDEGIVETEDSPLAPGALDMELIMGEDLSWALGLPLAAEGFESAFYRK